MTDHADDNELFKKLIQKPRIAWPTVLPLRPRLACLARRCVMSFCRGKLPVGRLHLGARQALHHIRRSRQLWQSLPECSLVLRLLRLGGRKLTWVFIQS